MTHAVRRRIYCAAVACALAASALLGSQPAGAEPPSRHFPLPSVFDRAADRAYDRVFFSGGPSSSEVVVTDENGVVVRVLDGLAGPAGLRVHESSLYIAEYRDNTIAEYDLESLEERRVFVLDPIVEPGDLEFAAGKLWVTMSCDGVGSVDPITGEVRAFPDEVDEGCARLASAPGQPNYLYVASHDFRILDASANPPTEVGEDSDITFGGGVYGRSFAISPDGSTLFVPNGGSPEYGVQAFDLPSYSRGRHYPLPGVTVEGVALSDDGTRLVTSNSGQERAIWILDVATGETLTTYRYPIQTFEDESPFWSRDRTIFPWSLTFSGDGARVILLTHTNLLPGPAEIYVDVYPTDPETARLRISASKEEVTYGDPVRVTVRLTDYPGTTREISLWRIENGVGGGLVKKGPVDRRGVFSATYTPRGRITLSAAWRGDTRYKHEVRTTIVRVQPRIRAWLKGGRKDEHGVHVYTALKKIKYQAYFVPIRLHDPVVFELEKLVGGEWKTVYDDVGCQVDTQGGCLYTIGPGLPHDDKYAQYRVRATMAVEDILARGVSPWSTFRLAR